MARPGFHTLDLRDFRATASLSTWASSQVCWRSVREGNVPHILHCSWVSVQKGVEALHLQEKANKRDPASVGCYLDSSGVGNEEWRLILAPGTSLVLLHGMKYINSTRSEEQSSRLWAPPGGTASGYLPVRDLFLGLSSRRVQLQQKGWGRVHLVISL